MKVIVNKRILKSKTLNWFQGKLQNNIRVMPNLFRHLIFVSDLIERGEVGARDDHWEVWDEKKTLRFSTFQTAE